MAGIQIQSLPTASALTGSELAVVSQNNVTKKTTIEDINAAPLAAASDAASDAASALSAANAAQSTANTAQSTANTAQSTANGKLSTVSVDGTTITGNGTSGNPLVASVPTTYQQLTKSAFLALVAGNDLVAGKSYLVEDAYASQIWIGQYFTILVTADSNNTINNLSWVDYPNQTPTLSAFLKCTTDATFSFIRFYETCYGLFLNASQCQLIGLGVVELALGCVIYVNIGGTTIKTAMAITGSLISIITNNVLNVDALSSNFGLLGEIDINADTFTPNPTVNMPYKVYTIVATVTGGAQVFNINATLQNTIGNIVWSYDSTGFWKGTLTGLCTGTQTIGYMLNNSSATLIGFFKIDDNTIGLNATDFSFSQTDNAFYGAVIEIRKYN